MMDVNNYTYGEHGRSGGQHFHELTKTVPGRAVLSSACKIYFRARAPPVE